MGSMDCQVTPGAGFNYYAGLLLSVLFPSLQQSFKILLIKLFGVIGYLTGGGGIDGIPYQL